MKYTQHLQVPLEISEYVFVNDLAKSFSIYLYLKMHSSGKLHESSPVLQAMRVLLKMEDPRTFKRYIQPLLAQNWIGFNSASGYYHVRGFGYLRGKYHFKSRQATKFTCNEFKHIQTYLFAVLLCAKVRRQRYFWEGPFRKPAAVTVQTDVTNHSRVFSKNAPRPPYYGLSNFAIAKELGYSRSRATELKIAAAKLGYLELHQHDQQIMLVGKRNYRLRSELEARYPDLKNKIRFEVVTVERFKRKWKMIRVFRQLHDEIVPLIVFRNVTKFNNLHLSVCVVHEFNLTNHVLLAAA